MSSYNLLPLIIADGVRAVANAAALPPGPCLPVGTSRWVIDEGTLYYWDGDEWLPLTAILFGETVEIQDNIIELNSDYTSGAPTADGGLCIRRGDEPDACIIWDEANDTWTAGIDGAMEPFPSASPAFLFSRSGAVPANTWLLVDGIPSNLTGHHAPFNGTVKEIFVDSSSISTYSLQLYQHDHGTFTLLTTVSVTAAYGATFPLTGANFLANQNLAMRLSAGSATDISAGIRVARTT